MLELDALDAVYGQVTDTVTGLGAADLMLPGRCGGWVAGDVLYHQLMDDRLPVFVQPGPPDIRLMPFWPPGKPIHSAVGLM